MTKDEAIKEARIGALLHNCTYIVARRGNKYHAHSIYNDLTRGWKVAEQITPEFVQRSVPGTTTTTTTTLSAASNLGYKETQR